MRSHEDFLPELDLVIEVDNQIIGNIMYTKAKLVDESGEEKEILTFGPVCIMPEYQRMGYGKMLMEYSFEKAAALAAYYSKGKESPKVTVDYIQKKHLKKPSGTPLGYLIYHTNYSLHIAPSKSNLTLIE